MKGIFVAVLAFIVVAGISADEFDELCKNEKESKLIVNPNDCSRYIECKDNEAKGIKACFDDTLFDARNGTCEAPETVASCKVKPTTKNDPCPAVKEKGIVRIPYPGNLLKYILCKFGKNKGYKRKVLSNGKWVEDQRYFNGCPADGRYKVRYEGHREFYFLCVNGIHLKTKKVKNSDKDELIDVKDLAAKAAANDMKKQQMKEDEEDDEVDKKKNKKDKKDNKDDDKNNDKKKKEAKEAEKKKDDDKKQNEGKDVEKKQKRENKKEEKEDAKKKKQAEKQEKRDAKKNNREGKRILIESAEDDEENFDKSQNQNDDKSDENVSAED